MARKILIALIGALFVLSATIAFAEETKSTELSARYPLTQVLILSRHNLRAPFVGDTLKEMSPHEWFRWTVEPGKLTPKGALRETQMGQCFRRRLAAENFLVGNEIAEGEVRFYANSFERTVATAKYFAAGMLPTDNVAVERHCALQEKDPVFLPNISLLDAAEREKINRELADYVLPAGTAKKMADYGDALAKVLDFRESVYAKKNNVTKIPVDDFWFTVGSGNFSVKGELPSFIGTADALSLQFYEEVDDGKVAFGKKFSVDDFKKISSLKNFGLDRIQELPTLNKALAKPLLSVMREELNEPQRKFTFLCGHDTNIAAVLGLLRVEDYSLPQTIEDKTPIGAKIVVEKRRGADGVDYAALSLVYMSSADLRVGGLQADEISPVVYPLRLKGLIANEDGLYLFDDLTARIGAAVD